MASNNENGIHIKQQNELAKVSKISKVRKHHLCDVCSKIFNSKKLLTDHFGSNHKNYIAAQQKIQAPMLEKHEIMKSKVDCSSCCKRVGEKYLALHKKKYCGRKKGYTCDICMKSVRNLEKHIKLYCVAVKKKNEKEHTCEICDKTFSTSITLSEHLENVHECTQKLQCDTCMKIFSRKADLNKHTVRVHVKTHSLKCKHCEKAFKIPGNLNRHIRESHEKVKNHNCEICEATFTRLIHLRDHIKHKHFNEKTHPCKVCGQFFNNGGALYNHVNNVHNEINFLCAICEKQFDSKTILKKHVDSVHGKIKNFECKFCHKTFAENTSMKDHILRVHEDKKKYQCTQCKEGFHYSKKLRAHIVESHSKAIGESDTNTIMNPKKNKQHNISEISISKRITNTMKTDMEEREMKDQSNVIDTSNPKYENTEDPLKSEIIETIEMKVEPFDCDPLALSNYSTVQIKTE